MLKFGWKRKASGSSGIEAAAAFRPEDALQEDGEDEEIRSAIAKKLRTNSTAALEDEATRVKRLRTEGATLAAADRFWEAVSRFDQALGAAPADERTWEMKAQALMQVHEWFPAIEAASRAVACSPRWFVAHQTLGRAQLGLGEVLLARTSLMRAVHLRPDDDSVRDDLRWAEQLSEHLRQERLAQQQQQEQQEQEVLRLPYKS